MTVGPVTLSNGDAEAEEEEQSMMCWRREKVGGEWVEMKYGSFISKFGEGRGIRTARDDDTIESGVKEGNESLGLTTAG